jgi:hypothetical protein
MHGKLKTIWINGIPNSFDPAHENVWPVRQIINAHGAQFLYVVDYVPSGTTDLNFVAHNLVTVRNCSGATIFTFDNLIEGQAVLVELKFTGGVSVTWPVVRWSGGTEPTPTGVNNKIDLFQFIKDHNGNIFGTAQLNF